MNILLAWYSRTGNTTRLIDSLALELESRGHKIFREKIRTREDKSLITQVLRDIHHYPAIFLSLLSSSFRTRYLRSYRQVDEELDTLTWPDVSGFDLICVGGPKWAQLSYPVARYLAVAEGLSGKQIGALATFGGPPLPVFEVALIDQPMKRFVQARGAAVIAGLYLSSGRHEVGLMPLFRLISRVRFGRPIADFTLESNYAKKAIADFCDAITGELP